MSTTSLIEFHDGVADVCHEFDNSWGGAAKIWGDLFEAYVEKKGKYDNWLTASQDKRLWQVHKDPRMSQPERLVYAFCCDNAIVKRENFQAMAEALRDFEARYPSDGHVSHLEGWAKVFEASDAEAIGLHATSVCENPWSDWDEEQDDEIAYDLNSGQKHWFVFEEFGPQAAEPVTA